MCVCVCVCVCDVRRYSVDAFHDMHRFLDCMNACMCVCMYLRVCICACAKVRVPREKLQSPVRTCRSAYWQRVPYCRVCDRRAQSSCTLVRDSAHALRLVSESSCAPHLSRVWLSHTHTQMGPSPHVRTHIHTCAQHSHTHTHTHTHAQYAHAHRHVGAERKHANLTR